MAIITEASVQQSTREIRTWTADFTDDIPTGGSITAGTAIHTPPSGGAASITMGTTAATVTATVGPLSVLGIHYLDIQATYSDAQKSEVRVAFTVNYQPATARVSMADLITVLRGLTNTTGNEYSIAGQPYWTDAQLQTVLDRHSTVVRHETLTPIPKVESGSIGYYEYQSSRRFFENNS